MFDDERCERLSAALREAACGATRLVPVGDGFEENERWVDRDLASQVEGWHGVAADPSRFTQDHRARCHALLARHARVPTVLPDGAFCTRWWVTSQGREAGALATARFAAGAGLLPLSSLYVDPALRRAGVGSEVLAIAEQAARAVGLRGLAVSVPWCWPTAVRFCVRRGFWVRHWKRDLALQRGDARPPYTVVVAGDQAAFTTRRRGVHLTLYRAARDGARLGWERTDACRELLADPDRFEEALDAEATFALSLALEGWPLARSQGQWERGEAQRKVGGPESLGHRVVAWEREARDRGLTPRTPRIPGLPYDDD